MTIADRVKRWLLTPDFWIILVPLAFYGALIRSEITYGDGPELLVAMVRLGGAHPSGYPLFTLLGSLAAMLPGWQFWNVAFLMSAVPGALAIWALYRFLLEFGVRAPSSAVAALCYGLSWHVAYQATRIEVYSLHCMLMAFSLLCLARFWRPQPPIGPAPSPDIRYAYGAVLFACLALTNHLTSVFLIVPVVAGVLLADHRRILRLKTVAIFLGIAGACAALYLYLPLQAFLNAGDRVSWNDPQTLERFWFHVSGKEYSIFRTTDLTKILPTAEKIWNSANNTFFPGIIIISIIGAVDWLLRHWRSLVVILLFELPYIVYVSTYQINDVATYFTGLFIPMVLTFGFGLDWLLRMRFEEDRRPGWLAPVMHFAVLATCVGWLMGLAWNGRTHHYREALAIDMSRFAMEEMTDPAMIFTSVDGHTFPMWYQHYIGMPDRKVAVIDTVMIHLKNKQWYRDHLRKSYPWLKFPDDETCFGSHWRQWILDNNPDTNAYALLHNRWPETGSYPVNRGWFYEIVRGTEGKKERGERMARHIYMAQQANVSGVYFHTSRRQYKAGEQRLACVTEWWDHATFIAKWRLIGPDGEIHEFNNHEIPKDSNLSWEYLLPHQQTPGIWACEVDAPANPTLRIEFELVE